jgi:thiol:disulfide interchange protein DsbG
MFAKGFRFMLPLALALALASCKDNGPGGSAPPATTATTAAPAAAAAPSASANMFDVAATGSGFTVGNMMAVRQVYVFFDPQCPHCGHLWEAAKPLANQVRMVWMPVGFISPKSTPQGAALLASTDPFTAMSAHEAGLLSGKGGMIPPDNLPAELTDKVKANTKLWQQLGGESVPTLVFKNPVTGEPTKFAGSMDTENLKKMLGI